MRIPQRAAAAVVCAGCLLAQDRPGLFFREDWKQSPPETPVTQAHVANSSLILTLHGPGKSGIKKSHHDQPPDDPYYIWSGTAPATWAVSLRHKDSAVDLTGQAKIRWRSKQAGFRQLRIVLKLGDGDWLVSDAHDPASADWREREFNVGDVRWRKLNMATIVEGEWVERPGLGNVEEIGFTDLMPGGESVACSRLDWIEVYGRPVPRAGAR